MVHCVVVLCYYDRTVNIVVVRFIVFCIPVSMLAGLMSFSNLCRDKFTKTISNYLTAVIKVATSLQNRMTLKHCSIEHGTYNTPLVNTHLSNARRTPHPHHFHTTLTVHKYIRCLTHISICVKE